jgi:hypothetical protein
MINELPGGSIQASRGQSTYGERKDRIVCKAVAHDADTHMLTELANKELQRATAVVDRDDSHCSTWLEYYLERLDGKEARQEYYARLEQYDL